MKIKDYIGFSDLPFACGRGLVRGKKYYTAIIRDTPAFQRYTGTYIQPDILHACTDYALSRELSGIEGIRLSESSNGCNYSFLEIHAPKFTMTTSLIESNAAVPRAARFRNFRSMSNQPRLFPDQEAARPDGKPYLILVHGRTLIKRDDMLLDELFGGIGMPCSDVPTRWNEFLSLDEYIEAAMGMPEEVIDENADGFLLIKHNFLGTDDDNDSA
jgi:hypothetical protein